MEQNSPKQKVLVTGGGGYVGSHCIFELIAQGFDVITLDNLSNAIPDENGYPVSLKRVQNLTNKAIRFYNIDIRNQSELENLFLEEKDIFCVIHCAALKRNAESPTVPLDYYDVNLGGTVQLLKAMKSAGITKIIVSGSCTVYGMSDKLPFDESQEVGHSCTTPYATTKAYMEKIVSDLCTAEPSWAAIVLRYFNPAGAHRSGLLGEDPRERPNNLTPIMAKVALGELPALPICGTDWETEDGTCVRDYVHIMDLAVGHVQAVQKLVDGPGGYQVYNLGLGKGYSVWHVHAAFSKACGFQLPYKIEGQRVGDVPTAFCDVTKAKQELGWNPKYDLDDMCRDLWHFYQKNPKGYSFDENETAP